MQQYKYKCISNRFVYGLRKFSQQKHVLIDFYHNGLVATVNLNKPKQLNCLSVSMFDIFDNFFEKIKQYDTQVIIIRGRGGNLSAGGDIKSAYLSKTNRSEDNQNNLHDLFYRGYALGYKWASMKPLLVVFQEGITIGGIIGWTNHSTLRISTEKTILAIPELRIGSIVDVGGAYWINQRNDFIGQYLCMTGQKLMGTDLIKLNFSDYYIKSQYMDNVYHSLLYQNNYCQCKDTNKQIINKIILQYQNNHIMQELSIKEELKLINDIFDIQNTEELFQKLFQYDHHPKVKYYKQMIEQQCPISIKLMIEYFQRSKNMSLRNVFLQDYRIIQKILLENDFYEGVKSVLIDKTYQPRWKHRNIQEITHQEVQNYFLHLDTEKDLQI